MKRIYSALFICIGLLMANQAQAGLNCTTDSTSCTGSFGAVCPSTLPGATSGTYYGESVTYYVPDSITEINLQDINSALPNQVFQLPTPAPISKGTLNSVDNLPQGLSWYCIISNCELTPNSNGQHYSCFTVEGTPCGSTRTYELDIELELTVDLSGVSIPGVPFQLPQSVDLPIPFTVDLPMTNTAPALVITKTPNTSYLCQGSTIDLTVPTGYSDYEWSTGFNGASATSLTVANAGTYSVTATDANGCTTSASTEIFALAPTASASATTICSNQFVQLTAAGGETYSWAPAANLSNANSATPTVFDLTSTTTFTVYVSNGICTDSTTVTVTVDDTPCTRTCTECVVNRLCTPSASGHICPLTISMDRNVAVDGSFSFNIMDSITLQTVIDQVAPGIPLPLPGGIGIPIDEIEITGVDGLPSGLTWETDQMGSGNRYYPNWSVQAGIGCVSYCGTTCAKPGNRNASLEFDVTVTLPDAIPQLGGTQQSFPLSIDFTIVVTGTALEITSSVPSLEIEVGDSLELSIPTTGFTDIEWSTGATSTEITVSDAGTYSVTVTDTDGCEQVEEATVTTFTSVADLNAVAASMSIFPNPSTGRFQVDLTVAKAQSISINIVNMQGRTVLAENWNAVSGNNTQIVDLSNAPSGIYFVRLNTIDGVINRKIVVE